jgi:glycosyltransferase involved in cell wall biosynthesis
MPAMPRITRISFLITDLHRGGSPLLLASLAPALASDGQFDVEVISIAPGGEMEPMLEERGVPVVSLNAGSNRDPRVLPRLVAHLRARRPEIVCSILIHANLLATLARPFVSGRTAWVQSIHTLQRKPRWHWYLQGILSSFGDALVAPSRAVIDELERYGPVPRPTVIPNGIEVAKFYHAEPMPPDQCPWPPGSVVVGYLGRFDPVKRLDLLVRGAASLIARDGGSSRLRIALVGYGPQEGALWRLARELGITRNLNVIPATTLPERWYKTFSVFCMPSSAEGFGLTLAESLCAGVPIVACDTSAVRATLESGAGVFWLPQDPTPRDVAASLEAAMSAPRLHPASLSELEAQYSLEKMVVAYQTLFQGFAETIDKR